MPTRNNKESVRESTNIVNPFIIREVVPNKTKKVTKKQPVRAPELKENYRVSDRIKESKGDVAELRNEEAQKYTIPYIPEKEIRLTTGRYNTGKISTNILDSIYNAAIRTGVPVDIALGLAGRESTLGIGRGFKRGQSITGTDLMSNWQQIDPYTIKNSVIKGYNDVAKKYNNNAPLTKEEADKMIKFFEENDKAVGYLRTMDENPIDNALKYYMSGKYNPGDKRHTQMVEEDAKVLMSDPAIQKWYQSKINTQMKCGGRRKAQLGLDIREGGIAIPIAPNMYYMNGRSHDDGGIAIGPNNKNGLEVEGGEVVEMIDSNHPSVGRQFKAGGQQQTMRVFSSVPFLRGASPAELVMGGANPDVVFKAQEEFKDRNRINDDGTMYKTGGIYIKASKRGTFTAAATKHGMGVQEFASKVLANKEDYSSAMVKKANFAKNASRWKKEYGGDDTKAAALKRIRNKFTVSGDYDGGMFGGAGAGSVIMAQPEYVTDTITKRYLVPVTQNFNDAFGNAVDAGLDKFMFDNKWYNTEKGNNPNNNATGAARTQTIYLPVEHKEVRRRKKELGGSMLYTINGNVKNGLSLRPKAEWGKGKDEKKTKNSNIIYLWTPEGLIFENGQSALNLNGEVTLNSDPEFMDIAIKNQSNKRPQFYAEKRMPMFSEQSLAEKFGLARSGWSHGEAPKIDYVPDINISVPVDYASNKSNSNKYSSKSTTPASASTVEQPAVVRRDEYYSSPRVEGPATPVDETYTARQARGTEAVKEALTYPKGTKTNEIDEPLIGKFKPFTLTDAISGLSNMIGSTASYFINRNLIDKYPMPTKPIMTPVVKLKTRFDVSGDIADIEESRRIAADAYKRNTSSSAAYLSRLQSGLNTAYRQKAEARRYGERMTNQLINADLQNRQNVYARNVAIQNDYYNRLVGTRQAKSQLEMQNLNNLISGLTGGVTSIMSNIDTRANYNKMAQAIQAANPNVDPRLLGIYDYYEGKNTGKKYNKRGQVIN